MEIAIALVLLAGLGYFIFRQVTKPSGSGAVGGLDDRNKRDN